MIRFRVVKETYGWAVRVDEGMMSPFPSRDQALEHAHVCARRLRRHGDAAQVVAEEVQAGRNGTGMRWRTPSRAGDDQENGSQAQSSPGF